MPSFLCDRDIKNLLGAVIEDGVEENLRPNSYVIRLGTEGEFLNSGKEFELGRQKMGIIIPPGHSVAVTSLETIDFTREAVRQIFPDCDLHGILSPTTDLSREGLVAPTTQIDAGFKGTLNWTINNTSNVERRFLYKEKIFRLTIIKLEEGETAEHLYDGDYQGKTGYVRSMRKGAPVGMKESEWVNSTTEDSPEALLENLLKSGYPWHALGQRLKMIDSQFKTVSEEYAEINKSITKISADVEKYNTQYSSLPGLVRNTLIEEASSLQYRWLIGVGSMIIVLLGLVLTVITNDSVLNFLKNNGAWIGVVLIFGGICLAYFLTRKGKKRLLKDT